eukprot:1187026-Prorocentrum_minimum.AAC.1
MATTFTGPPVPMFIIFVVFYGARNRLEARFGSACRLGGVAQDGVVWSGEFMRTGGGFMFTGGGKPQNPKTLKP